MEIKNRQGEVIHTIEAETAQGYAFHKLNLEGADFSGQDLSLTGFYMCQLKGANFSGAKLYKADFHVADLTDADLTHANLKRATLLGTQLMGARLTDAQLEWAHFKGTKYSDSTQWPKGFKPELYETIRVATVGSAT